MWRLYNILSGLRAGLCIGAAPIAAAIAGVFPLLPALGVVILGIGWTAWDWERLREYNRSDRY